MPSSADRPTHQRRGWFTTSAAPLDEMSQVIEHPNRVGLDLIERAIFLRRTEIGRDLPDGALRAVAEVARELDFAAGTVLAYEEDLGPEMFLIVSGRIEVRKLGSKPASRATGDALGIAVGHFGEGSVLGEMAVLDDERRSASMIAQTDLVTLAIHREDLRDAVAVCPDLAFGLFRVLAARIRKADERLRRPTPA